MSGLSSIISNLDKFCNENIKAPFPRMWFRGHYITLGGSENDPLEEVQFEYEQWVKACEADGGCD